MPKQQQTMLVAEQLRERARRIRREYYASEGLDRRRRFVEEVDLQPSRLAKARAARIAARATAEKEAEPCPKPNKAWLRSIVEKGLSVAKVLASADVPDDVCDGRLKKCRVCKYSSKKEGKYYCGCCGCPAWNWGSIGSDLEYKCRKAAWRCPGPNEAFGPYDPPHSSGV